MSESHRLRAVCAALLLSAGFLTPAVQAQFLEPPPPGSPVASATGPFELPPPARLVEARRRRTVARAEVARRIEEVRVALGLERLAGGGHGDVPSAIYATAGGRIESTSAMDAAEKFLAAIGPVLGLTQRDMENVQRSERASFLPGYREIIARRTVGGLPLFGASVRIHVGPRGELAAAVGTLYGHLRMADGPARLTEADAAGRASRAIERITGARGVPARAGAIQGGGVSTR